MNDLNGNILGCFYGLAIGDALGAPVEFMARRDILTLFGSDGVQDFHAYGLFPRGSYTDDTQMSLATARGLIKAFERGVLKNQGERNSIVWGEYKQWLATQADPFHRRAPGNTCVSAIARDKMGSMARPLNNSKGCGGIMRVAPVGWVFDPEDAFQVGAELAGLTHGHPSGFLSAGFLASLIAQIKLGNAISEAIDKCINRLKNYERCEETLGKVLQAIDLRRVEPKKAIPAIGQGWIAEETLGIALYCSLACESSYRDGVLSAVNHSGDRDSCGSVAGAILGTILGDEGIPLHWRLGIENRDGIEFMSTELLRCSGTQE